ncbi:peptidase S8 and S53 subtilisin kexin sedolisin [Actinobacteria bacterium OK074]|nr:peptidase S8 and S53 subtilisin kexin sedolisin [Actinobacteria bacterium OK074]
MHRTTFGSASLVRVTRPLRGGAVLAAALLAVVGGPAAVASAAGTAPAQWYLGPMKAEAMWKVSTGAGIKVAVIGTGVNPDTASLRGQVLTGVDASVEAGNTTGSSTDTADTTGEGTTVAELIAGTGKGGGIQGLAPGARIIPIRVPAIKHDDIPDIDYPLSAAVEAAVDSGARIIDFAVGNQYVIGSQLGGDEAFTSAVKKGVLMIAGVGDVAKEGNDPQYPAAYNEVAGVGAVDETGTIAPTSQWGQETDLGAPGTNMPRWCDATFTRYCTDSGGNTMAASAIASASAALLWARHPDWNATQVWRVLEDTAGRSWPVNDPSMYAGYGMTRPRINLLEGKGNPGSTKPDAAPWFVYPATSKSAKSTNSPTPSPSSPSPGATADRVMTAAAPDDGLSALNVLATVAAFAVLAGGAAWALVVVRRRRQAR